MPGANQLQHQIHGRGAAGGGVAIAVDGEQPRGDGGPREGFLHCGQAFPVHAAVKTIEQAGLGQRPAAGAYRAKLTAMTRLCLQPVQMLARHAVLNIHTAADDDAVQAGRGLEAGVRRDLQAVAGADGLSRLGHGEPAVQFFAGQLIGHPQRFHGRGQGNQGEVVQQQEADGLWEPVRGL